MWPMPPHVTWSVLPAQERTLTIFILIRVCLVGLTVETANTNGMKRIHHKCRQKRIEKKKIINN